MVIATVGIILLSIVFLVLVTSAFYASNNSLYSRVKASLSDSFEIIHFGSSTTPDDFTRDAQDVAVSGFSAFYEGFRVLSEDEADRCFYYIEPSDLSGIWRDYEIRLDRVSVNGNPSSAFYLIRTLEEADDELGNVDSFVNFLELEGTEPCLVYGETQTTNFYANFLSSEKPIPYATGDLAVVDVYVLRSGSVYSPIFSGESKKRDFETEDDGAYVLYKNANKICVFPTRDGGLSCSADEGILDDDCFDGSDSDSIYEKIREQGHNLYNKELNRCTPGGLANVQIG